MAQRQKRNTSLRHLVRELVRENFLVTEVFEAYADAMEEEAKRLEVNPQAKDDVDTLEREAMLLRKLGHDHRSAFASSD